MNIIDPKLKRKSITVLKNDLFKTDDLLRYPLYDRIDIILSCIRDSNRNYDSMNFISTLLYYICQYDANSEYKTYKLKLLLNNFNIKTGDINFFNTTDILVFKYNLTNNIHEYNVGKILNNLRNNIPNFGFTFINIYNCKIVLYENSTTNIADIFISEEVSENTEIFNSLCIIKEKVKGTPLEDFLKTATLQEVVDIILQTCLALSYAYDNYKFIHNNLNLQNIIIDKRDRESIYKYKYNGADVYLTTNILVSIINYEKSYIEYENNIYNLENEVLHNNFILYDILLIILECIKYDKFKAFFKNIITHFLLEFELKTKGDLNVMEKYIKEHNEKLLKATYNHLIFSITSKTGFDVENNLKFTEPNNFSQYEKTNQVINPKCLDEINLFLKRTIQFEDCTSFYDFYINSKKTLKFDFNNNNLYITTSNNKINFNFIQSINSDIDYINKYISKFKNFLINLYKDNFNYINSNNKDYYITTNLDNIILDNFFLQFNDKKAINFIKAFIINNYFMIKFVIENIYKVLEIYKDGITEIEYSSFDLLLKNMIEDINSISFIKVIK